MGDETCIVTLLNEDKIWEWRNSCAVLIQQMTKPEWRVSYQKMFNSHNVLEMSSTWRLVNCQCMAEFAQLVWTLLEDFRAHCWNKINVPFAFNQIPSPKLLTEAWMTLYQPTCMSHSGPPNETSGSIKRILNSVQGQPLTKQWKTWHGIILLRASHNASPWYI